MRVVVCVKQIPDPASPYDLDPETHFLQRPTDQVLDDTDRYGVEMGLQLAEKTEGSVALVSMGPAGQSPRHSAGTGHGRRPGRRHRRSRLCGEPTPLRLPGS